MNAKTKDAFPKQDRYRHRHQADPVDPLEAELARAEAQEERLRAEVQDGILRQADPADLRGIPVQAAGVGGASPGTRPGTRYD